MFNFERFEADVIATYKSGVPVAYGNPHVKEGYQHKLVRESVTVGCCVIGAALLGKTVPEDLRGWEEVDAAYTLFQREFFTEDDERAQTRTNIVWGVWDNMVSNDRIPWTFIDDDAFEEEITRVLRRILRAVS